MKYILNFLAALLWLIPTAWAQQAADTLALPTEKALLWEISGNGLSQPSYVFGTIHIISRDDYFFTSSMQQALESAETVAFEINMEDMSDFSKIMGMMAGMYMNEGKTLRDLLSDEDYSLVEAHFKKKGLPLAFLERIKPMFLSMLAGGDEAMNFSLDGSSDMVSYEMELMSLAKAREIEIAGLETIEYQMSLFDSIPYDAQAKMLVAAIQAEGNGQDQLEQMVALYKAQDIHGMQAVMDSEEGGLGGYEEILLLKRNRNWIPSMIEMMGSKPVFFAVGAGHLGGPEGVLFLLRQAGYEVRPVLE